MSQSPSDVRGEHSGILDLRTSDRHKVLAAAHRRLALDVLNEQETPVDLEDLAAAIARLEADGEVVDEKTVERLATSLHHNHLPIMAELDIIDYDPAATVVES